MTREEIETGNQLIAVFMGEKLTRTRGAGWVPGDSPRTSKLLSREDPVNFYYDSDWNAIMPVFKKLKAHHEDDQQILFLKLGLNQCVMEADLPNLHHRCVEFIKFINSKIS